MDSCAGGSVSFRADRFLLRADGLKFNNALPRRFSFDVWRPLLFRYFGFPIHRRGSLSEVRILRLSGFSIRFRLPSLSLPNVKDEPRP